MNFFTTGRAVHPIRFDLERQEARFTLRDKNHRFYVVTTSVEQYELMKSISDQELLIVGTAFSFLERAYKVHRVGFKPMLLMPLDGDIGQAEQIITQLVKFTLSGLRVKVS